MSSKSIFQPLARHSHLPHKESCVFSKWTHRKLFLQAKLPTLNTLFGVWFHWARFQSLNREQRRYATFLRKQKFAETVALAQQAASRHDTHQLFDIINRFAPKAPLRKMQLRNEQGILMTPPEERKVLIDFVKTTWQGDPMKPLPLDRPIPVPFTVEALADALRRIPSSKAVAPTCAPGLIWNSVADLIAPTLHAILTKWWTPSTPWIPINWRSGWLQLIPKPNKPPTRPQNLRPLALQCPVGKAVMGLIIQLATQQADPEFRAWPLWAFLSGRSTQDPLNKVASHCRQVRDLLTTQKSTPHSRAMNRPIFSVFGGLQIFVDLERAFDSVNRTKLFSKLAQVRITPDLAQLLQGWHVETDYFVTHAGVCTAVPVQKGLRQECKGAPFLWNCLMALVMQKLHQTVSIQWIRNHLSIYADDCHICGVFRSQEDFQALIQTIGVFFQILQDFDLRLNPHKSVAILEIHGPGSKKLRSQHVQRDNAGERLKITLRGQKDLLIPIEKQTVYLGCIMGYHRFEDATTWHRAKLAHVGFLRLRRWLCNKHRFSLQHRLQLWRTCIVPIMTYGIFAVGITSRGTKHLLIQITKMLRLIVHDHPHHTGNSNAFVFQQYPIPSPADVLTAAVKSLLQSVAQRQLTWRPDTVANSLDWTPLAQFPQLIATTQAAISLHRVETALSGEVHFNGPLYTCTQCAFQTSNVSSFRRHCTVEHGIKMFRAQNIPYVACMTNGLPECSFCKQVFSSWCNFRMHIERGCQAILLGPPACTGVLTNMALPAPAPASKRGDTMLTAQELQLLLNQPWGQRVLQLIADDALDNLEREQEACQYLSRYCCLCGHHLHRTQDVHLHFKTEHAAYWDHVPQKALVLTNLHSSDGPCPHCGGYFRQHKCPVWTQISVLMLHGAGLMASDQMLPPDVVHRCEVCLEVLPDIQALTQHLKTKHGLAGISYNVARDSLSGQAACAHCGKPMSSMESLRSHIVQGHCPSFNPLATAETLELHPEWVDICLHGNAFAKLRAPMSRLHLTLRCLHCPQTYKRAGDLANHLMTSHSRLWRWSQRLTLLLVELIFARHGCMCNPQINQVRQNHICLPLRQLAMAYHRLDPAPFMPVPITENVLNHLLDSSIPRDSRFALIQLFVDRRFADLWKLPQVRQMLSTACLMCGHAQEPGLICRHFFEAHMCTHQFVEFYMETLLPMMQQELTTDYRCDLCGQIFNLPASDPVNPDATTAGQVQTHLQGNCPVLIQASLLLATALNGGRLGDEWLGLEHPATDTGHLLVPGANLRQVPAAATQSEASEGAQDGSYARRPRRSRSARNRPGTSPEIPPGPGPILSYDTITA